MQAAPFGAGCGGNSRLHRNATGQFCAADGGGDGGKQAAPQPEESQARCSVAACTPWSATMLPLFASHATLLP